MRLVVITQEKDTDNEHELIVKMFEAGLKVLHIRKPEYSKSRMRRFIESIPVQFHNRLVLHSWHSLALKYHVRGIHFTEKARASMWTYIGSYIYIYKLRRSRLSVSTSVHRLSSLKKMPKRSYSYVFLSPVFKSISKDDYKPTFSMAKVQDTLRESKVKAYALGGVDANNIWACKDVGFLGVGVLGCVWEDPKPVEKVKHLNDLCKNDMMLC